MQQGVFVSSLMCVHMHVRGALGGRAGARLLYVGRYQIVVAWTTREVESCCQCGPCAGQLRVDAAGWPP